MLLAIHPRSPFWSNPLAVFQKSDMHNKARRCDFEKPSITFVYFVLPAITMGSLLLNNSPWDLQKYVFRNNLRKCVFEQPSITFRCFVLPAVSKGSLVLNNTPLVLHKPCGCKHLWKCISEQHSVTLRMLTNYHVKLDFDFSDGQQYHNRGMSISNYLHKIDFWTLHWSTVSQCRRADDIVVLS